VYRLQHVPRSRYSLEYRLTNLSNQQLNRKVLSAYLRKRGFDFVEAENGDEGVNIFDKHPRGHFELVSLFFRAKALLTRTM
jgi:CheY-like chemotaxis protein